MSVHAIVAEIRADTRAFRRRRRCGDQALDHETKDSFCADLERRLDDLVRAIGTPAELSLGTGSRYVGSRSIPVVTRTRRSSRQSGRA